MSVIRFSNTIFLHVLIDNESNLLVFIIRRTLEQSMSVKLVRLRKYGMIKNPSHPISVSVRTFLKTDNGFDDDVFSNRNVLAFANKL